MHCWQVFVGPWRIVERDVSGMRARKVRPKARKHMIHFASYAPQARTRQRPEHPLAPRAWSAGRENTWSRPVASLNPIVSVALRASTRQHWALPRLLRAPSVRWASIPQQRAANQAPHVASAKLVNMGRTARGPCAISVQRASFRVCWGQLHRIRAKSARRGHSLPLLQRRHGRRVWHAVRAKFR